MLYKNARTKEEGPVALEEGDAIGQARVADAPAVVEAVQRIQPRHHHPVQCRPCSDSCIASACCTPGMHDWVRHMYLHVVPSGNECWWPHALGSHESATPETICDVWYMGAFAPHSWCSATIMCQGRLCRSKKILCMKYVHVSYCTCVKCTDSHCTAIQE